MGPSAAYGDADDPAQPRIPGRAALIALAIAALLVTLAALLSQPLAGLGLQLVPLGLALAILGIWPLLLTRHLQAALRRQGLGPERGLAGLYLAQLGRGILVLAGLGLGLLVMALAAQILGYLIGSRRWRLADLGTVYWGGSGLLCMALLAWLGRSTGRLLFGQGFGTALTLALWMAALAFGLVAARDPVGADQAIRHILPFLPD